MFKSRWFFIALIASIAGPISLPAAEGGDYTIRSNPSEVRVLFTAEDAQGRRITQLEPKDVAIVDNEQVIRRFRSFRPASETPLHVVILVDISDSVSKQVASELELVKAFVGGGRWGTSDQVSVLAFSGTQATALCSFDCRSRQISLRPAAVGNTTPLYDALIAASKLLARTRDANSRAAIILLSDGSDTVSTHSAEDAISSAQAVEASVYAVNSRDTRTAASGDDTLAQIAAETGGVAYAPGRCATEALNAALDDLRQGFVLTYELPRSPSARHEIRVVPALNSRLRFRSRQGYTDSGAQ